MAENGSKGKELTPSQAKAITALLETRTIEQAAERAGVGARTLYRWLAEDDLFNTTLRHAEGLVITHTVRGLLRLNQRAVQVLEEVLNDEEISDSVRLRAATATLETTLKLRELRNVEERLSDLERMVTELLKGENAKV